MILQRVGIPIYLQVKTRILDKIRAGEYRLGDKIPTEREMAAQLEISRNTVSAAYKELLLEGVLEARQGKGTFVNGTMVENSSEGLTGSKRERLANIIDDALAKATELGFTAEQFAIIAHIRAQAKTLAVQRLRVVIVDCTAEFTHRFVSQINQTLAIRAEEVLLSDLEQGQVPIELLHACDLVVTTTEHYATLVRLMGTNSKIATVAVMPRLEAIIQLARIPTGNTLGIIARSSHYLGAIERLLTRIQVNTLQLELSPDLENEALRRFIEKYTIVVTSEEMEATVRQLATDNQEIIVFTYDMDQGSMNQLLARLIANT